MQTSVHLSATGTCLFMIITKLTHEQQYFLHEHFTLYMKMITFPVLLSILLTMSTVSEFPKCSYPTASNNDDFHLASHIDGKGIPVEPLVMTTIINCYRVETSQFA